MADSAGSRDALTNHDVAIQLGISGSIDGAHPALAELGGDSVVGDDAGDHCYLMSAAQLSTREISDRGPLAFPFWTGSTVRYPCPGSPCSPQRSGLAHHMPVGAVGAVDFRGAI